MCKVQFTVYSVSSICVSLGLKRCLSIEAVNIKHNTKQGLSIVRDMTFSKDNIHYLYLSFSSFHPSPPPSAPLHPPIPRRLIFPSLPASFRPSSSSHTYPPISSFHPYLSSSLSTTLQFDPFHRLFDPTRLRPYIPLPLLPLCTRSKLFIPLELFLNVRYINFRDRTLIEKLDLCQKYLIFQETP